MTDETNDAEKALAEYEAMLIKDLGLKRYGKPATRILERKYDERGNYHFESICSPTGFQVYGECQKDSHLPGLVIFVHGVNSEGEWYDKAENALCQGLNDRLGRHNSAGQDFRPNIYKTTKEDPITKKEITIKRTEYPYDDNKPSISPVIRFYWGYRPKDEELENNRSKYILPLRNVEGFDFNEAGHEGWKPWYWGGGPFQNGCNSLNQLWDQGGFKKWLFPLPVSVEALNSEVNRQLNDSPPRVYYQHAVKRLVDLINKIRAKHPKDTISIISHSQGTMIAMAAAAISPPDALFLMNSPFALEYKSTDSFVQHGDQASDRARRNTFINVVKKVASRKNHLKDNHPDRLHGGYERDKNGEIIDAWSLDGLRPDGVKEHDNHGRTYVYFNPHDRVMGMSALESIGWQGLPDSVLNDPAVSGHLFQRMLGRLTPCGDKPNARTPFGTLPDMPAKPFWSGNRSWSGNYKVLGAANLWTVPPIGQTVNINAEAVPKPIKAEEMVSFEKLREEIETEGTIGFGWGQVDSDGKPVDPDFKYFTSIYQPDRWYPNKPSFSDKYGISQSIESRESMLRRITKYIPVPANHSTLPENTDFMRRVVAYDLPIGHCRSGEKQSWMQELRIFADWTQGFDPYFRSGELSTIPMPPEIDQETSGDITRKESAEQQTARDHSGKPFQRN